MINKQNLIPLNKRTKSEQSRIARLGGIKSGKVRRENRTIDKIMERADIIFTEKHIKSSIKNIGKNNIAEIRELGIVINSIFQIALSSPKEELRLKALQFIADRIYGKVLQKTESDEDKERYFTSLKIIDGDKVVEIK